jgi:hypothetical protein
MINLHRHVTLIGYRVCSRQFYILYRHEGLFVNFVCSSCCLCCSVLPVLNNFVNYFVCLYYFNLFMVNLNRWCLVLVMRSALFVRIHILFNNSFLNLISYGLGRSLMFSLSFFLVTSICFVFVLHVALDIYWETRILDCSYSAFNISSNVSYSIVSRSNMLVLAIKWTTMVLIWLSLPDLNFLL